MPDQSPLHIPRDRGQAAITYWWSIGIALLVVLAFVTYRVAIDVGVETADVLGLAGLLMIVLIATIVYISPRWIRA